MTKTSSVHSRIFRAAAVLASGALVATGLGACSGAASPDGTRDVSSGEATVDFWGWVPGLEDLVDEWNSQNPDIQVSFHRMTGDDGAKVEAAVDAGAGPDLVQLSTHNLPDYVIAGRVQPIGEYVEGDKSNYTPASWAAVSFDGEVYGVPQGIGPAGTMYREDIFAQYGIDFPTNWDEYLDAARELHAANPDVYIANMSPTEFGQWVQEVSQAEGTWYDIEGDSWSVSMNGEQSQLVAERWQTLLDEGLVTTEQMWTPEYWALVNDGKIASISYAAWFPSLLAQNAESTSGLWRVAPMPVNAGTSFQGDSGGAAVVVLTGAQNPAAAAEFASWLNGSDETQEALITVGGLFPSTINGLESPALLEAQPFYGDQVINEVFIDAAKNTPDTWVEGPNFGTATTALTDEFSEVVTGAQTFAQALDNAQAAVVADLEARGLNVSE
ncbi:multiple sugar transport system substrate-binding protein [Microbacterium halimionae]|uniref:Multiple sugar transport system substrate-binding protein n=1 Tax=Microbacterium halimionae TaxID=1526413 RepID=A0A7W3PMG5_9MICO|nr:extracellular solute-binding protein [Microbacterium halimionae]MBA8817168.1 multiple sugar transport system substrate-binding protein [Microbacterium halimionae]NII94618.1 multiple sugar transport system substrate-binding protein [Microbacterium halimionae]